MGEHYTEYRIVYSIYTIQPHNNQVQPGNIHNLWSLTGPYTDNENQ